MDWEGRIWSLGPRREGELVERVRRRERSRERVRVSERERVIYFI